MARDEEMMYHHMGMRGMGMRGMGRRGRHGKRGHGGETFLIREPKYMMPNGPGPVVMEVNNLGENVKVVEARR